jgi:hypothetical protein
MPPQPSGSQNSGRPRSPLRDQCPTSSIADFQARLDSRQVEGELDAIFRESPEFGRNLAFRLEPFLGEEVNGALTLIGAGGEATVFGDPKSQQVIKLSGPPARCNFGWIIRRSREGILTLSPGSLDEILDRLSLFEALFSSGITIDSIGENDSFLLFRQPFIGGRHPTETELHNYMRSLNWAPLNAPCIGDTLEKLTWQKGRFLATDVRSENAIISEATGTLHPIDFIVAGSASFESPEKF